MNKILLILQREYLTRIRKKSFIVMTILGPLLLASTLIIPIWVAQMADSKKVIQVVDETRLFYPVLTNTENITFVFTFESIDKAKKNFFSTDYDAILYIPDVVPYSANTVRLFAPDNISLNIKIYLQNIIRKELEKLKLQASGIQDDILKSVETPVEITTYKLKKGGDEEISNSEISTALGLFGGILIYFFIFMFGTQVMRGVIEEKVNRIVEIIVSSVKPFQLMMGKIIGVALVGLTQFLLWVVLTFGLVTVVKQSFPNIFQNTTYQPMYQGTSKMVNPTELQEMAQFEKQIKVDETAQMINAIKSINFGVMIFSFIFYFLGGYLLYAALFAAVGAAVDNESDTQQFMLPITLPLIVAFLLAQFIINNPQGPIAFWLSIIPLTSPIIMMIRIPFGVPYSELALSMGLLVIGFIATTWLAAKIYRTGILMYGKKINYSELWKWLKY